MATLLPRDMLLEIVSHYVPDWKSNTCELSDVRNVLAVACTSHENRSLIPHRVSWARALHSRAIDTVLRVLLRKGHTRELRTLFPDASIFRDSPQRALSVLDLIIPSGGHAKVGNLRDGLALLDYWETSERLFNVYLLSRVTYPRSDELNWKACVSTPDEFLALFPWVTRRQCVMKISQPMLQLPRAVWVDSRVHALLSVHLEYRVTFGTILAGSSLSSLEITSLLHSKDISDEVAGELAAEFFPTRESLFCWPNKLVEHVMALRSPERNYAICRALLRRHFYRGRKAHSMAPNQWVQWFTNECYERGVLLEMPWEVERWMDVLRTCPNAMFTQLPRRFIDDTCLLRGWKNLNKGTQQAFEAWLADPRCV